jgi:hypothetical protein
MAVMLPVEGKFWLVVNAPAVTTISIMLAMPIAISAPNLTFGDDILLLSPGVILINREY